MSPLEMIDEKDSLGRKMPKTTQLLMIFQKFQTPLDKPIVIIYSWVFLSEITDCSNQDG